MVTGFEVWMDELYPVRMEKGRNMTSSPFYHMSRHRQQD